MQHENEFLTLVNECRKQIKETNVPEINNRISKGDKLTLIDVREDNEWAQGHIPNAIHLGRGVIERDIEKTIPNKSQEIILYCGGGFRSALAAFNLQKMGYTNVISMDGGVRGWLESGLKLEN
jgi:rhodanese-related sulfurtransferase